MKNLLIFCTLLFAIPSWAAPAQSSNPQTITDVLGRSITLELPAKRVVIGFYGEDYMAIGGEKSFDHVVGMSKEIWQKWRPKNWALYVKHRPSLATLPEVGKVDTQTFSVEKVISLKPDVLLLADWQYQALKSEMPRFEAAGVHVVVVDYNAQTLERHMKSTQVIGELTGQVHRAEVIAEQYKVDTQLVFDRLAKANLPKPKVYVEYGFTGPQEYGYTFGANMWGRMAMLAGGDNIAAPFIKWWGHLNPEQVIAARPDVIFLTGTEFGKNEQSTLMGEGVSKSVAQQRLAGFEQRMGWASLPAVQNHRIYGMYHYGSRSIMDASMLQFMAKAMYPKLFADIHPEQKYRDFYAKYLPVTPTGTFMVSLQDK